MDKYRKKPVVIEAYQMTAVGDVGMWPQWLKDAAELPRSTPGAMYKDGPEPAGRFQIMTLEGTHTVSWDDWIIQGVQGELYPCKPDIFAATYEPVKEEANAE